MCRHPIVSLPSGNITCACTHFCCAVAICLHSKNFRQFPANKPLSQHKARHQLICRSVGTMVTNWFTHLCFCVIKNTCREMCWRQKTVVLLCRSTALPRSGGSGGRPGRWIRATSLPPMRAQMKRLVTPKRLPPGRHSFSVMDHTAPKSTAAKRAAVDTEFGLLQDNSGGNKTSAHWKRTA